MTSPEPQAPAGPERASKPSPRFYHPELDGLRFVAFAAVFCHHALPNEPLRGLTRAAPALAAWVAAAARAGAFGVDLFFVLSAYLITELLLYEQRARGAVDIRAFYIRRALRIWPLYYAFLVFVLAVAPRLLPREDLSGKHAVAFALFGANWACALWGYPRSVAAPLWSVSIEEQFYLAWPLVIWLLPREKLGRAAAAMIAIATMARLLLAAAGTPHPGIWCNTFARLDPIAAGILTALALHGRATALRPRSRLALGATGVTLVLVVARFSRFEQDPWGTLLICPVVALASVAILVATLSDRPSGLILARAPLVYLGRISYGLYIFHAFGLAIAAAVWISSSPLLELAGRLSIGLAVTVAMAMASYRWIEQPFLRLKARFTYVASRPGG